MVLVRFKVLISIIVRVFYYLYDLILLVTLHLYYLELTFIQVIT